MQEKGGISLLEAHSIYSASCQDTSNQQAATAFLSLGAAETADNTVSSQAFMLKDGELKRVWFIGTEADYVNPVFIDMASGEIL